MCRCSYSIISKALSETDFENVILQCGLWTTYNFPLICFFFFFFFARLPWKKEERVYFCLKTIYMYLSWKQKYVIRCWSVLTYHNWVDYMLFSLKQFLGFESIKIKILTFKQRNNLSLPLFVRQKYIKIKLRKKIILFPKNNSVLN